MTIELLYTSAAQGLKQGSRGFCTVVCTAGLPINLAQRLEALSGYRHLYQPSDQRADDNPVCYSHVRLAVGGKTLSILSRVGAYGVDYSQRTNKIAHHVVFDGPVPECGPAAVLAQSGIMRTTWDGECKTLQSGPEVSSITVQPAPCKEWKRITGDAGWAGVVASAWMQPTGKPVWIVFSELQSASLLELMQEATAILPESRRWQATFSTYCTNLPPDVECRVRCVIAGSDEARMSIARGTVLDLTKPMGLAPDNDATEAARNGCTVGSIRKPDLPSETEISDLIHKVDSKAEGDFDSSDYGLQPEFPGYSPPAINKAKFKRGENPRDASSTTRKPKSKKTIAYVVAGLMLALATFASFTFLKNTFVKEFGFVEDIANNKTNDRDDFRSGDIDTSTSKLTREQTAKADSSLPISEFGEREKTTLSIESSHSPPSPSIRLLKDKLAKSEFDVFDSVLMDDFYLADIDLQDLSESDLTKIHFNLGEPSLSDIFLVTNGRLMLKGKELANRRSMRFKVAVYYEDRDIKSNLFEFNLNFVNEPDPNIELRIVDEADLQISDFAANTILEAKVTSKDIDEVPGGRKWRWYSRNSGSTDQWELIDGATKPTYKISLESDIAKELKSKLEYDTNDSDSEVTKWVTEVWADVKVLELSAGRIVIPSLGIKSIEDSNVSVRFSTPTYKPPNDTNSGKSKTVVHHYKINDAKKIEMRNKADTEIPLKQLLLESEIKRIQHKFDSLKELRVKFKSMIDNFQSSLNSIITQSKNKHFATIDKVLFPVDASKRLFNFIANYNKVSAFIEETLELQQLWDMKKDDLSKDQELRLATLGRKFIDQDTGYETFNGVSLLKDMTPDMRKKSVLQFCLIWKVKNGTNIWNQLNLATPQGQDLFAKYEFNGSAIGTVITTLATSQDAGGRVPPPILEFPVWLKLKIDLPSELEELVRFGTMPNRGIQNGKGEITAETIDKP